MRGVRAGGRKGGSSGFRARGDSFALGGSRGRPRTRVSPKGFACGALGRDRQYLAGPPRSGLQPGWVPSRRPRAGPSGTHTPRAGSPARALLALGPAAKSASGRDGARAGGPRQPDRLRRLGGPGRVDWQADGGLRRPGKEAPASFPRLRRHRQRGARLVPGAEYGRSVRVCWRGRSPVRGGSEKKLV